MAYNFDNIAPTYDRLNHLMTMGIDRAWRRRAVSMIVDMSQPLRYLDVATGTGDLAQDILRRAHDESSLTGIDLSQPMMDIAKSKIENDKRIANAARRLTLQQGDAERISFADESFDRVTVGFGVRNFVNLQRGLDEMCRVLRVGGRLAVLELSYPDNSLLLSFYKLYALRFLPWLGERISHDRAAYEYLPNSILRFPKPDRFVPMLQTAGFSKVEHYSFTFGVCRLYVAEK
ncbi:MAG: bifunctional demethylmenaquinone methyltransferase/2-methoxy-6-polyprenyl-1,4-benzoquinol methylase UbiE [Bacteroidales bacterium]|nr:bifunctional demethylmenaquinone methyltransferase/2-methoxy-6-polyprenyl-1,4-benzoquinol methylase UbiE [Bacteroidales bacterium]